MSSQHKNKHLKNTIRFALERGKSKVPTNIKSYFKEDDESMSANNFQCDDFSNNGSEINLASKSKEAKISR